MCIFVWLYACLCVRGRYNNGGDCNTPRFSKRSYEEGTYLRIHPLPSRSSPPDLGPSTLVLRLRAVRRFRDAPSHAMCRMSREREREKEKIRPLARDFYKILYWYTSNRYRPLPLSPPLMPGNYRWDLSRFIPGDLKARASSAESKELATNLALQALFSSVMRADFAILSRRYIYIYKLFLLGYYIYIYFGT